MRGPARKNAAVGERKQQTATFCPILKQSHRQLSLSHHHKQQFTHTTEHCRACVSASSIAFNTGTFFEKQLDVKNSRAWMEGCGYPPHPAQFCKTLLPRGKETRTLEHMRDTQINHPMGYFHRGLPHHEKRTTPTKTGSRKCFSDRVVCTPARPRSDDYEDQTYNNTKNGDKKQALGDSQP